MGVTEFIVLVLKISILLMVFGFALQVSFSEAASLLRQPGRLLRTILAMNVVMPVIAVALVLWLDLRPEIKLIIVAFALSPMPPFMPGTQVKAGGDTSHVAGLLTASSALSVIIVPLALLVLGMYFSQSFDPPVHKVAMVVGVSVLAPLAAGLLVHHLSPPFAMKLAKPVTALALLLLAASGLAVAAGSWQAMLAMIGDRTILAIGAIVALGLLVGFLFGGPGPDDRTILALATAARHPGVALAIAGTHFADQKLLLTATLLYLIVSVVLTTPFALWRGHRHQAATHMS